MSKCCDLFVKERLSIFTTPDSLEVKLSNLVQSEIDNFALFNDLRDGLNTLAYRSLHRPWIKNIVVIGCGGTGSWLIPKLVKTMNDLKRKGPRLDILCYGRCLFRLQCVSTLTLCCHRLRLRTVCL